MIKNNRVSKAKKRKSKRIERLKIDREIKELNHRIQCRMNDYFIQKEISLEHSLWENFEWEVEVLHKYVFTLTISVEIKGKKTSARTTILHHDLKSYHEIDDLIEIRLESLYETLKLKMDETTEDSKEYTSYPLGKPDKELTEYWRVIHEELKNGQVVDTATMTVEKE